MTIPLPRSLSLESLKRGVSYKTMRTFKFVWVIRNFSFYTEKTGEKLESPVFQSDHDDGLEWCLDLYPRGFRDEDRDYLSLYLRLVSKSKARETVAKFEFYIWNMKGEKSHQRATDWPREFKSGTSDKFGFPHFISRTCLLDRKEQLLINDRLTILCHIECTTASRHATFQPKTVHLPYDEEVDIVPHLFQTMAFSDVIFNVNGRQHRAHKAILAARSPIFAAMFQSDMKEGLTNQVSISDMSNEALEQMLCYIYNGDVDDIEPVAEELLAVADKYQLNYLKAVCEEELWRKLSVDNVAKYLVLADAHSALQLKQLAIDYINEHSVQVVQTQAWNQMIQTHLHLLPDIYLKSIQKS